MNCNPTIIDLLQSLFIAFLVARVIYDGITDRQWLRVVEKLLECVKIDDRRLTRLEDDAREKESG